MLRATLRSFLAYKGRLLLSCLAVLLSVAFVSGSLIFSDTVSRTFDALFKSTAADVTVSPKTEFEEGGQFPSGRVPTLPAEVRDKVARVEGVQKSWLNVSAENITVVDSENNSVGPDTGAPTIADNWYVTDRSPVELTSGHAPRGPDEALIDADTAEREDLEIGDPLRVQAAPGSFDVRIVGIATFTTTNPGATLVFLDTATAQRKLLGKEAAATGVQVQAEPGVADAALKKRIAAALGPADYEYETAAEQATSQAEDFGEFIDILTYVMVGFAGVAVLVGVFLIVNTFSMLIAQRTRELGLLRALGADRRQVRRSVLTEALLLGVLGSTLGLGAGIGLALGLIGLMSAFGMNLEAAEVTVRWSTPVAAYVVGVGVTFFAAYLPARRAARISPMAALADVETTGVGRPLRVRAVAGTLIAAAGAAALVGCALSTETSGAFPLLGLGIVCTLVATVIAGPLLVRPVIRVLGGAFPRVYGSVGRLSQRNALRNPRRTGATASALMVGLALVVGMSVAASSITLSFDEQIDRSLGADLVVQNDSFGPFPQEVTDRVRGTDGVGTLVRQRIVQTRLTLPDGEEVMSPAAAADPGLEKVTSVEYVKGSTRAALRPGRTAVSERFAEKQNLKVGARLSARLATGERMRLTVAAVTRTGSGEGLGGAGLVMGLPTLEKAAPGGLDSSLLITAASGTETKELRASLDGALEGYPQVKVRDRADYKELVREQIAVLLYLLFALVGLAIVIAVLGVVNTLALSVVERTRELGLLRAIGMSRRQLRRMVRLESVVIAVFGAVLGLGLGLVWGVAIREVLALEGMTALGIPWWTIGGVVVGSALIGLVAALLPALRASRMNVLAAIAHE
ncbi:ABC transporter permease [Streptomyces iconiensis]|uniref:ABC transporter permease n=1 Tax=Streptomyces iconiensis TaxID=1384038 RepID=A0ABT7A8N0_9ACTN|nr:ABC transporter permease [Streptomyces iconiensis]MDJ1137685.1 ABC transporter permease [Streptomyces iconiensis]